MKTRVTEAIAEETVDPITRSSPRRRKRVQYEEVDEPETTSPASKRVKKQANGASKADKKVVKREAEVKGTNPTINRDSEKQSQKRRQKAVTSKAEESKARDPGSAHSHAALNGDSAGTSTKKRRGKEPGKKVGIPTDQPIKPEEDDQAVDHNTPKKRKRKAKELANKIKEIKEQDTDIEDEAKDINSSPPAKSKRKRKTPEEKAAEAMPLAARTPNLRMYVGAHVSIAKGLQNSITNIQQIGGNAFALFLKSQRKWENPALTEVSCDAFRSHCTTHSYDASSHVLPHGSYLVNLAQEESSKASQAYSTFIDDLHRCERLGIKLYNFHPGASGASPLPIAIQRIARHLNTALAATTTVTPLLENMAGSGTVIGSRFSDLRDIIAHIEPQFTDRIGVCLDTCHAFAAGYDLRTPASFQTVLEEFDAVVGMKYLRALHLNDSKAPLGSKRDLHQNIGLGFLGLRAFHNVMNEKRFEGLPLILETPCEKPDPKDGAGKKMVEDKRVWAREIKLLEGLIGMDVEGEEFKMLERELAERGREEREKMTKAVEAKEEKSRRKLERGQRSLKDMMGGGAKGNGGKKGKEKEKGHTRGKQSNDEEEDDDSSAEQDKSDSD